MAACLLKSQAPIAAAALRFLVLYELKLDGYRALIIKDGKQVALRSRNDKDLAKMYPSVAAAAAKLRAN